MSSITTKFFNIVSFQICRFFGKKMWSDRNKIFLQTQFPNPQYNFDFRLCCIPKSTNRISGRIPGRTGITNSTLKIWNTNHSIPAIVLYSSYTLKRPKTLCNVRKSNVYFPELNKNLIVRNRSNIVSRGRSKSTKATLLILLQPNALPPEI